MKLHFSQIFQEFFHGAHEIQVPFYDERERQSVMDLPRVSTVLCREQEAVNRNHPLRGR